MISPGREQLVSVLPVISLGITFNLVWETQQDAEGIQNMSGVSLIGLTFIK